MSSIPQVVRSLARSPGFTAVVVISLGLGIGACTSAFSVLNALVFAPLPYADAEQLVELHPTPSPTTMRLAGDRFQRTRVEGWTTAGLRSFDALGWQSETSLQLEGDDGAERVVARIVSGNWFSMMGLRPMRGRVLLPEDDSASEPAVLISEDLWEDRLGGSAEILGSELRLSGTRFTVVGVVSKRVTGGHTVWVLGSALPTAQRPFIVNTVARLAPGVSMAASSAELQVLTAAEVASDPVGTVGHGAMPLPFGDLARRTDRGSLWLALGLAGGALLMALTNLVTLFLVRAARRARVAAVRIALGAGMWQLGRGLVTEGLLLGGGGAVLGLVLSVWGRHAVTRLMGSQYTLDFVPPLDWRVFAFAAAVSIAASLLLAAEPLRALRLIDVRGLLQRGGAGATASRSDSRARHAVVAVQVAAALVVALSAIFTVVRHSQYFGLDLGYDAERIVVARPAYPMSDFADASKRPELAAAAEARLGGRPGVAGVGAFYQSMQSYPQRPEHEYVWNGEAGSAGPAYYYAISPGFMELLDVPILRGRGFTGADGPGAPEVAIINESAARMWLPGQDPLGKQLKLGQDAPWITIVGVSSDFAYLHSMGRLWAAGRQTRLARGGADGPSLTAMLFRPLAQAPATHEGWSEGCSGCDGLEIAVRAEGDVASARENLRRAMSEIVPNTPLSWLETLMERQESSFGGLEIRTARAVAGGAAALTLLMAILGVLGVVTDSITRRTREIGIRVALGANRQRVVASVARDSLLTCGIGLALGVGAALLLRNGLWRALDPISLTQTLTRPTDAPLLAGAVTGVLVVTLAASLLAARRATRISPAEALRHE